MISLNEAARRIRTKLGLSLPTAACQLSVTELYLEQVESGATNLSAAMIDRYVNTFGIDPHVLAWAESKDFAKLPANMRGVAAELAAMWGDEIEQVVEARRD